MAELPAGLDHKIGPYPLGAWVGLIGGGVALGLVLRARRKSSTSDGTLPAISDAAGNPTSTSSGAGVPASSTTVRGGTVSIPTGTSSATGTVPATNSEWGNAAIRYLVGTGVAGSTAQAAIERFLAGYGLTTAEQAIVSKAIEQQGPPPETAPPITTAPEVTPQTPEPFVAPPAPVEITGAGSLVSPDGNTVFLTDGVRIRWVTDGNQSKALMLAGARVKSIVNEGTPDAFPEPLYMAPQVIRSLRLIGPPPPGWPTW